MTKTIKRLDRRFKVMSIIPVLFAILLAIPVTADIRVRQPELPIEEQQEYFKRPELESPIAVQEQQFSPGGENWLGNYTYRKEIVIGNATGAGGNYTVSLVLHREREPVESNAWVVATKTYNNRIPIRILAGANLTGYQVKVVLDTATLVSLGYQDGGNDGMDVEFDNATPGSPYYYWLEEGWNTSATVFWVKTDLTANVYKAIYLYLDTDQTGDSSFHDPANVWDFFEDFDVTAANKAAFLAAYTDWEDASANPPTAVDTNTTQASCLFLDGQDNGAFNAVGVKWAEYSEDDFRFLSRIHAKGGDINHWVIGMANDNLLSDGAPLDAVMIQQGTTANPNEDGRIIKNGAASWELEKTIPAAPFTIELLHYDGRVTAAYDGDSPTDFNDTIDAAETYRPFVSSFIAASTITVDWIAVGQYIEHEPAVHIPPLWREGVNNHVGLDDGALHWPYDVVFTDDDGSTQLWFYPDRETEVGGLVGPELGMETYVRVTDSLESSSVNIYVYYSNAAQTSEDTYWDASNVFTFYDGFTDDSAWTEVDGTWAVGNQQRPVYKGGPFRWARQPIVIKKDSTYYMFYLEGSTEGADLNSFPQPWVVALATSPDFIHWERYGPVFVANDAGITEGHVYFSHVWEDGGTYYALYTTASNAASTGWAGIATSSDLITWTPDGSNPILDYTDVTADQVWGSSIVESGGTYNLFYSSTETGISIGYANSTSLTGTYTDQGEILTGMGEWGENVMESPFVLHDGNDTWYMFYSGGGITVEQRVGYATASNANFPGTWADQGAVPDISEFFIGWNAFGAGTPIIYTEGSTYYMFYYGNSQDATNAQDNQIGYATSTDLLNWTLQNVHSEYQQTNAGAARYRSIVTGGDYTDVEIMVELQRGASSARQAGIAFRYDDADNYYYAAIDVFGGQQRIIFNVIDAGTPAAVVGPTNITDEMWLGQKYRLRVRLVGTDVAIDYSPHSGEWIAIFDEDSEGTIGDGTGNAGLITNDVTIGGFDNFRIRPFVDPEPIVSSIGTEEEESLVQVIIVMMW